MSKNSFDINTDLQIGLAEALYDNQSEWPDELGFKKGDFLKILTQTPKGDMADGWWLCVDHLGRKGIVPANRLKMVQTFAEPSNLVITSSSRFVDEQGDNNNLDAIADNKTHYFRRFNPVSNNFLSKNDDDRRQEGKNFHGDNNKTLLLDDLGLETLSRRLWNDDDSAKLSGAVNNSDYRSFWSTEFADTGIFDLGRPTDNMSLLHHHHRSKSPPPPIPLRRHYKIQEDDSPVARSTNSPVKIVNPFYSPQQSSNKRPTTPTMSLVEFYSTPITLPRPALNINNNRFVHQQQQQIPSQNGINSRKLHNSINNNHYNNGKVSDNGSIISDRSSSISADSTTNGNYSKNYGTSIMKGRRTPVPGLFLHASDTLQRNGVGNVNGNNAIAFNKKVVANGSNAVVFGNNAVANGNNDVARGNVTNFIARDSNVVANSNGNVDDSLSISSVDSNDSDYQDLLHGTELPANMNSIEASGRLVSLRQNMQINVRHLCAYTVANWRKRDFLMENLNDIQSTCRRTVDVLKAFVDFASGCFVNMMNCRQPDDHERDSSIVTASKKLAHLLRPLRRSLNLLIKLQDVLNSEGWNVEKFVRDSGGGNDNLDQFIAIAKQTPEDVRQVATFVHSKFCVIFPSLQNNNDSENGGHRQQSSLKNPNKSVSNGDSPSAISVEKKSVVFEEHALDNNNNSEDDANIFDDYDFVEGHQHPKGQKLENSSSITSPSNWSIDLSKEDKQILLFYTPQVENHMNCLSKIIDEFLASVERNESPRSFVANGRLVVLGAHKLIYIGDNVAQCVKNANIAEFVKTKSDRLCEVLKFCVAATKQAALQYPVVASVQTMVDSMVDVSQGAHDLALSIYSLANL